MKILFLGLASSFTPGMYYQENLLVDQTLADGHQVTYFSNPERFENGVIRETGEEDSYLQNGLHLVRFPYVGFSPIKKKIRLFRGVKKEIEKLNPDIIFCHNTQYFPILDAASFKRKNPNVRLYADTHTAAYNSGKNWLSLHVLHRVYYKWLLQRALPYLDKYYYIGESERLFAIENYGVPESLMEYYPLGGIIFSPEQYQSNRNKIRKELGIREDMRLYVHSGKLDAEKRTEELLKAFSAVKDENSRLVILGMIPPKMEETLYPLIDADERVSFLGWKSGKELQEYLCACDLYCQPGSASVTMQNAVCCGCAIMAYPYLPYTKHLDWGNILWAETQADIERIFAAIQEKPEQLDALKENSKRCGKELLDYRKLAARLYE